MKTINKIYTLLFVITLTAWIGPIKVSAQDVSVSFQVFYDDLSPYGTWVDSPDYGYVWVPAVSSDFTPYGTNGHWVLTDDGWTWVSDYSWGWAPFHYGRWYYDASYGSIWIPGEEWGPAWVDWRSSDGYYGWAAMGPGGYSRDNDRWRFVKNDDFGRTDINNYYVNSSKNTTYINNTTVINNRRGPDRAEVEKRTGRTYTPIGITGNTKHSQISSNGKLELYRPKMQKNTSAGQKPVPSKVTKMSDAKPATKGKGVTPWQNTKQPTKAQPTQQHNQPIKQQPTKQ